MTIPPPGFLFFLQLQFQLQTNVAFEFRQSCLFISFVLPHRLFTLYSTLYRNHWEARQGNLPGISLRPYRCDYARFHLLTAIDTGILTYTRCWNALLKQLRDSYLTSTSDAPLRLRLCCCHYINLQFWLWLSLKLDDAVFTRLYNVPVDFPLSRNSSYKPIFKLFVGLLQFSSPFLRKSAFV
ncbi:hypothetical protein P389DRAFT_188705 [Cystobasidium minutum MCA 4210]|uniref:uncharacterized protein n=1 Tax=Cystobasidium minutum MCA 4210 TaxID=1397322 RepID=UPI0034CD2228|eukprot:jgi/Rhomi1/188705/estExt_fgenesh1_pg.C_3_t10097